MRIAASKKYLIGIILVLLSFMTFAMRSVESTRESTYYDSLDNKWQKEALSKDPSRDPRSDNDQLRPVVNYDGELIAVNSFGLESQRPSSGKGWQLAGGVVDIILHRNSKYILYGRRNLRYKNGLWNNVIDTKRSFEDYLVVKRTGNNAEILIHKKLIPATSQILIGSRHTNNADGFEIIQNSQGLPQVIWSHRF